MLQKQAPDVKQTRTTLRLRFNRDICLAKVQKEPSPPAYRAAGEGCSSKNKTLWSNTESPVSKRQRE